MNPYETAARALAPLCLGAALVACESVTDLDERPPTFISPSTFYRSDADAVAAVNGAYQPLLDWNLWRQPAWISLTCDEPELQCQNWMAGGFEGRQAGQWYVSRPWTGNYQIIARVNDAIEGIGKSAGISAATKKLAVGQVRFLRGYAYFDLVRRFGGVPLRLEPYAQSAAAGTMPRASVPEVYAQIVTDLKAAADSLPATYADAAGGGRPSTAAAWGLLAKVYLHMAGAEMAGTGLEAAKLAYADSARMAAGKVMESGTAVLEPNYMDLFDVAAQNSSREILFSVQASGAGIQGSELPGFFAPQSFELAGGGAQGFISLRRDFYDTFAAGDKRAEPGTAIFARWNSTTSANDDGLPGILLDSLQKMSVVKDSITNYGAWEEKCGNYGRNTHMVVTRSALNPSALDTTFYSVSAQPFTKKYTDTEALSKDANSNNPIILRYADVLLIQAEAENEVNGPTGAAYAAINQVRSRAGLPALAAGSSKDAFRQAVWTERQHELYAEFQSRFDLVRQGRWLEMMNSPSPLFPDHGVCRPRQEYQILFPLPESELAGNPEISQNPGY